MSAAPTSWNLDDVDAILSEPAGYDLLLDDTDSLDGMALDESLLDLNFDDNSLMDWSIMYNNPVTSHHPEGSVLGKRLPSQSSSAGTPPPSPCGEALEACVPESSCLLAQPKRRKKTRKARRSQAPKTAQHATRPEQKALTLHRKSLQKVAAASVQAKSSTSNVRAHVIPVQPARAAPKLEDHHFLQPNALQQRFLAMTLRIFKNTGVCV